MKLSKRLQLIADQIPKDAIVADIGCDHGKLLQYALNNLNPPFVFGSDISEKSVNKTSVLLTKNNFVNFKTLVSDGLNSYNKNELKLINCIVIAGMGGHEIVKVLTNMLQLKDQLTSLKILVLQPQNNEKLLREWLQKNCFTILFDKLIYEKNNFYNVIKVIPFTNKMQSLSEGELEFGKTNLKEFSEDFESFLNYEIIKLKKVLAKVSPENKETFNKKLKNWQKVLNKIKELKN